jgi:hypothetical protein
MNPLMKNKPVFNYFFIILLFICPSPRSIAQSPSTFAFIVNGHKHDMEDVAAGPAILWGC